MAIVLDGTTGLAGAATGALNGALGATTPSTVAATTVVASSTIKGATTIAVGNATPSASGAGITFPATQSASTDANTLDDYEEGTWTPNQGGGLTVVGTFSSSGFYIKTGRLVTIWGRVRGSTSVAVGANGAITSNLPFAPYSNGSATGNAPGCTAKNNAQSGAFNYAYQNDSTLYSVGALTADITFDFFNAYYTQT